MPSSGGTDPARTLHRRTCGRTSPRCVAAAVGVLLVLVVAAAPATAEKVDVRDHRHDVWDPHYTDEGTPTEWEKIGDAVNANLLSVTTRHQPRRIVVVSHYTDLARNDEVAFGYLTHRLRLDGGAGGGRIDARIHWGMGRRGLDLTDARTHDSVECDADTLAIDYRAETVKASIPRSCLRWPDTVAISTRAQAEIPDAEHYVDAGAARTRPGPLDTGAQPGLIPVVPHYGARGRGCGAGGARTHDPRSRSGAPHRRSATVLLRLKAHG